MQPLFDKDVYTKDVYTKDVYKSQYSRRQLGQGMTEYIIIVAIIAIGAVAASSFFGARVQAQFVAMGSELSGEAGDVTGGIQAPTPTEVNLGTYGN